MSRNRAAKESRKRGGKRDQDKGRDYISFVVCIIETFFVCVSGLFSSNKSNS